MRWRIPLSVSVVVLFILLLVEMFAPVHHPSPYPKNFDPNATRIVHYEDGSTAYIVDNKVVGTSCDKGALCDDK